MFVCNFKINKKRFVKVFTIIIVVLAILILSLSLIKIFSSSNKNEIKSIDIESNNYTDFLRECHNNIDEFVGINITITGYVYRMSDFNDNQFVIARTMLLPSKHKAVVVGILAECDSIKDYENYTWITCKGTIKKGYYNGDMPVVQVEEIKKTNTPEDEYVYPPE